MFYRFRLSLIFNYGIDRIADTKLRECIRHGIKSVTSDSDHYATATFKDGSMFTFWNVNRYYAWLCSGTFKTSSGEKYHYKNSRPTAKTMYRFKQLLSI